MSQLQLWVLTKPQGGTGKVAAWEVLFRANAGASHLWGGCRDDFYRLKGEILKRYANPEGEVWQRIDHPCWGCDSCGGYNRRHDDHDCGGTKIYRQSWFLLKRWRLGRRVFLVPHERRFSDPGDPVSVYGRVRERYVKEEDAHAAFLTLRLWFDRDLFRKWAGRLFCVEEEREELPF